MNEVTISPVTVGERMLEALNTKEDSLWNTDTSYWDGSFSEIIAFSNRYSLSFDGTDDYIHCGASAAIPSLQIIGTLTISCWFNSNSTDDRQALVAYSTGGTGPYIITYGNTNEKIEFWQSGEGVSAVSSGTLTADTWHHVAVTRGGSSGDWVVKIYLNGSLDSTTGVSVDTSIDYGINGIFTIGRFGGFSGYYMNGEIDEVGVWDTVLDADAITAIYNSDSPMDLSSNIGEYDNSNSLQAWWRMGDGTESASGNTIYDMSNNSNNGTFTDANESGIQYSTLSIP